MTGPKDLRHDTTIMYKADSDLQRVLDDMVGHLTRMNGGSEPVLTRGQGVMFAALRTGNADLNNRANALLERLRAVKELAAKGTSELNYSDQEHAQAAQRALADPHTAAPLGSAVPGGPAGSVGGVQINV